jgi:hypothetical protein
LDFLAIWTQGLVPFWVRRIFCVTQTKSAVKKQHSDKDKEILRHQPSSPDAASSCPVTQTLPSTFLVVVVTRVVVVVVVVVVAWGCQGWWL